MIRTRIGALVAATAIMVAACGGSTASTTPSEAAPSGGDVSAAPSVDAGTPKEGGTLIVGLPGDMVLADPSLVSDSNSSYIHAQRHRGSARREGRHPERRRAGPRRPSCPTLSSDGLTYTFKLRDWHQVPRRDRLQCRCRGLQLRASEERPRGAPRRLQLLLRRRLRMGRQFEPGVGHCGRPATVEFKLKTPQSNFLISQAPLPQFGIQSPTALKAGDADNPDPSKSAYAQGPGDRHGRDRPVQVQGVGSQRPRHDREERRLLERRTRPAPRRGDLQAIRRPGRRAERPPGR